jgi:hypothetical protein
VYQQQVVEDSKIAATMSKYHDISDSASDSDPEPSYSSSRLDGSQDLFDSDSFSASGSSKKVLQKASNHRTLSQDKSALSSIPSSCSAASASKPSPLKNKAKSKSHNISDSDSDTACRECSPSKLSKSASVQHIKDKTQNKQRETSSNKQLSSAVSSASGSRPSQGSESQPSLQECKYGSRCYRTNAEHFQEFSHGGLAKLCFYVTLFLVY